MVRYKPTELNDHLQQGRGAHAAVAVSTRKIVFTLLGVAAIVGWTFILLMSDLFEVNRFEVRGVSMLDPAEVSREAFNTLDARRGWRPWSTRNVLFMNQEKLANDLRERLFAEHVTVDKTHRDVLRLIVEERAKRLVFHSHKQYFWVDLAGVVTDELTLNERTSVQARILGHRPTVPTDPPVVHRNLDEQLASGYVIDESQQVRNWVRFSTDLIKGGLLYREFKPPMSPSSSIAYVVAPEGYQILIDADIPLKPQLDTYNAFKRAQPKAKVAEYLDIRIPGRVYIK